MRLLIALLIALLLSIVGCDVAEDTADEATDAGVGAAGIAEQMSSGTVGDADMDTGESAEDEDEMEEIAGEISGE
jgi:hypothetical protein